MKPSCSDAEPTNNKDPDFLSIPEISEIPENLNWTNLPLRRGCQAKLAQQSICNGFAAAQAPA